jgi:hypothetical protein
MGADELDTDLPDHLWPDPDWQTSRFPPAWPEPRAGGPAIGGLPVAPSVVAPSVVAPSGMVTPTELPASPIDSRPSAAEPESSPGRRWLNVVVANPRGDPVVTALALNSEYILRINIGRPARDGVIARNRPFPDHDLPRATRGWCLDVVTSSDTVEISREARELFLPTHGDSWMCDCGWRETDHRCDEHWRRPWLDIAFRIPVALDEPTVLVQVYYGATLLQAARITLPVIGGPPGTRPWGKLEYTRNPDFRNLDELGGRDTSLYLSPSSSEGRHRLVVNNGQGWPLLFEFVDHQTAQAATGLRTTLYHTHLDGLKPRHSIGKSGQPVKDDAKYAEDLLKLAETGAIIYRSLVPDSHQEHQLRSSLMQAAARTGRPALIQIARSANTQLSLPW